MADQQIRFDDGASYERMMGTWSRLAGEVFLDWLVPANGLRWIDVGCGNGAFTEMIVRRCAPAGVQGVDPSEGQLAYARTRAGIGSAEFRQGGAMELPFPARSFDVATMALVIFFVPEPAKGVAEMARVVRPGGLVASYAWDMFGGGFPLEPIFAEVRALGGTPMMPPSADASRADVHRKLWIDAGLLGVETREITVERTFADYEDFWSASALGSSMKPMLAAMSPEAVDQLKARVRDRLPTDGEGRITYSARANAVKGRLPE